jgi:hypothetical protein
MGALALGTVGAAVAQNAATKAKGAGAGGKAVRGKGRAGPLKKALPNAADPLAAPALKKAAPAGSFHFKLRITMFDSTPLAATYYPSRLGTGAPVLLLIHEKDRSGKDFEEPIGDLKGEGLALHLQGQGYAVLILDLRGQGANPRRALSAQDWREMVADLQGAYQFLVDRHNRGELNLAKLGVVALGEGANLAAAWASLPGGAVSNEGRTSDLAALVLVSPLAGGEGFRLHTVLATLAPRVPLLVMAGQRDAASSDPVKAVRALVERPRLNKVEFFPSSLHGYKLLRLEPKATSVLNKFLEGTIRFKADEWEPRYNLNPVSFTEIQVVRHDKTAQAPAPKAREKKADAAKKEAAP